MGSTVWSGQLQFGLVSFPVKLSVAARGETVSFNLLHDHGKGVTSRIKQITYCQLDDKPIPKSELVRGYEHEKDRYVILSDDEIKGAAPTTAHVMEILEFVPVDGIDPLCYETSYFVAPDNGADKPYALLYCALKQRQSCGIARLAMHNREHIVILRPGKTGLVLHTVFYSDEIRQTDEYRTDTSMAKPKELAMADMLIDQMAASFELNKYHDTYRTNLLQLIQQKVSGSVPVSRPVTAGTPPVIDVLEALRASLDAAQKKKKGASA